MLRELHIGNFKAFGRTQVVPIKPLTLVFGANSSGKSSIIHSLILAHHAIETGDVDAHRTRIGGDAVDLGGFRRYIYGRDPSRQVQLGFVIDPHDESVDLMMGELCILCSIGIPNTGGSRILRREYKPRLQNHKILVDGRLALEMSDYGGNLYLDRIVDPVYRRGPKLESDIADTAAKELTPTSTRANKIIARYRAEVPSKGMVINNFLPQHLIAAPLPTDSSSDAFPEFFDLASMNYLVSLASSAATRELHRLRYLGPLRTYPPRHIALTPHHDPSWETRHGSAWDILRDNADVRDRVNEWLNDPIHLQTPYELTTRNWVDQSDIAVSVLPALDETIKASYKDLSFVKPDESLDEFRNRVHSDPSLFAWHMTTAIHVDDFPLLDELVLIDRRSNTRVSHRDVGIGISQVLPVLVEAYASNEKLIAIEQPEIHLHPALQAELGDVFITSARGEQRNTFILETHSEHLILRIMRRMRETVEGRLPDGIPPVRPDDVAILFVEPTDTGSVVRHLELDEDGQLLDPWPGGFFEEGYRERFS